MTTTENKELNLKVSYDSYVCHVMTAFRHQGAL